MLDDSALLALGRGYPALSGFIVDAAAGRAVLAVPALCLCAAEAQRPGIADHIGALPVHIEPLDLVTTVPVGRLIGQNIDWRIAHAVAAALPSVVFPQGRVVLSVQTGSLPGNPGPTDRPRRDRLSNLGCRGHGSGGHHRPGWALLRRRPTDSWVWSDEIFYARFGFAAARSGADRRPDDRP